MATSITPSLHDPNAIPAASSLLLSELAIVKSVIIFTSWFPKSYPYWVSPMVLKANQ